MNQNHKKIESQSAKRKRSPAHKAVPQPPQIIVPVSNLPGNVTQINYLMKARNDKMKLIEGDSETFSSALSLIDDYEGALQRHESLAANLGAKLVGPLLIKSFEKLFEGPIKIIQAPYGTYFESNSVTWLDIIEFAGANPNSFVLSDIQGGGRVCQFWINQCCVQISEDDYRLILSGAPERMIPMQPVTEDEISELGTLDILEQRLQVLIRKADLVAGRARQLNYHLKGRRTAIQARRATNQSHDPLLATSQLPDGRQSSTPFQAINNRLSLNGETQSQNLHQDLLRQFLASTSPSSDSPSRNNLPARSKSTRPSESQPATPSNNASAGHGSPQHDSSRRLSQAQAQPTVEELSGGQYRPIMTTRNEKLSRGEQIWPPCDRCRRLRMDCTKYLTACAGCTKKHAKCTWNDITEVEVGYVLSPSNQVSMADNGDAGGEDSDINGDGGEGDVEMNINPNLDPGLREVGDAIGGGGGIGAGSGAGGLEIHGNGGGMFTDSNHQHHDGRGHHNHGDENHLLSRMASSAAAAAAGTAAANQ